MENNQVFFPVCSLKIRASFESPKRKQRVTLKYKPAQNTRKWILKSGSNTQAMLPAAGFAIAASLGSLVTVPHSNVKRFFSLDGFVRRNGKNFNIVEKKEGLV